MKKVIFKLMLSLLIVVSIVGLPAINADAVVAAKGATAITGGAAGSLDSFDGSTLNDGDVCFVFYGTNFYFYKLDADSGLAESSPTVIAPDSSAGTKRWILQENIQVSDTAYAGSWDGVTLSAPSKNAVYDKINLLVPARINKVQTDSPYTVTAANCSGMITVTNTGATGETIFNLPAGADGYRVRAIVTAAQYLTLDANGTETIRYLTLQSAAGGYVRSNVIGNVIELEWSGTEWVVVGMGGNWTYDE